MKIQAAELQSRSSNEAQRKIKLTGTTESTTNSIIEILCLSHFKKMRMFLINFPIAWFYRTYLIWESHNI